MSHLRHRTFLKKIKKLCPICATVQFTKNRPGGPFLYMAQLWLKFAIVYHPLASRICIKKTCEKM